MDRRELFLQCWVGLGAGGDPEAVLDELETRWSEPARRYHTLEHLDHCLSELRGVPLACPARVFFAAFAHDVVCDPRRKDNEQASVGWALRRLEEAAVDPQAREAVAWMILATRHDGFPEDRDAQALMDADLAILGADPERYARYERQVREEYAHVPLPLYRAGRARLLKGFLKRPVLYLTEEFRDRLEEAARANLERSVAELTSVRGLLGLRKPGRKGS